MTAIAAKGVSRARFLHHALRNALNPVLSLLGLALGGFLSGAVVVESVFDWPGLGALTVDSILNRDMFVAVNCVMVAALAFLAANLVADILLALNDPRVRRR
jgi:ABC-type dipeptide/oligopeptide/nickel transport system permease component